MNAKGFDVAFKKLIKNCFHQSRTLDFTDQRLRGKRLLLKWLTQVRIPVGSNKDCKQFPCLILSDKKGQCEASNVIKLCKNTFAELNTI